VQGEFRNDFDLHRYPFDDQELSLSFFNARAATDRIVYVIDRRSSGLSHDAPAPDPTTQITSLAAFRNLSQWALVKAVAQRDNLVTDSALGDPSRTGVESYRELSGFKMTIDVRRRALATLGKTLLPLGLMTLIMFASLYFPVALVKEKVTVAITAALSGAVLLTAINSQLGGVGYTIAVEYVFYAYFGLSLLCIVSVLSAERLRAAGRAVAARQTEMWTRVALLIVVAAGFVAMLSLAASQGGGGASL
jgi:branched-chain amino acid transport system substrate-binding protein